jgi:hypothetical protein
VLGWDGFGEASSLDLSCGHIVLAVLVIWAGIVFLAVLFSLAAWVGLVWAGLVHWPGGFLPGLVSFWVWYDPSWASALCLWIALGFDMVWDVLGFAGWP